jgi:DNA repair protein RadA/Sms
MILAVLNSRLQLKTSSKDAFVATVGGVRLSEPAADLAVALALASAGMDVPLPPRMTAFGEVSLSGEVRPVTGVTRRLQEAARLGFTSALVPAGTADTTPAPDGLKVIEVRHVHEAVMRTVRPLHG